MKDNFYTAALSLLLLCVIFSCTYTGHHHHTDVSISNSDDTYKLHAYYDEDKTREIQRYINKCIRPNGFFESINDYFDITTELKDRTRFYIKASPGKLLIKLNKRENTEDSYLRIKNMCDGIVAIIKEK